MAAALSSGWLRWRDAEARERGRQAIDAIVPRGQQRDRDARAHLAQTAARETFIRRASLHREIPAGGAEHLRAACARGRGVLVSYSHLSLFPAIALSVADHAQDVHQIAGTWLIDGAPGDPSPERRDAWRALFDDAGIPLIPATGCFPVVRGLLEQRAVVVMAANVPGSTPTAFLGKTVWLASGTARLATATDALIVPVHRELRRLRPRTVFGPPLDPRDHASVEDLHCALAARHERWILKCPAALEDPRRPGAWGAHATADGWGVPASADAA